MTSTAGLRPQPTPALPVAPSHITMHRCGHNADVYIRYIMCIGALVTKYVFIVHCVY